MGNTTKQISTTHSIAALMAFNGLAEVRFGQTVGKPFGQFSSISEFGNIPSEIKILFESLFNENIFPMMTEKEIVKESTYVHSFQFWVKKGGVLVGSLHYAKTRNDQLETFPFRF